MSIENCEILFPDFNACFAYSKDFPESALIQIPKELHSAIDVDNADFFSNLKVFFPKLFNVFTLKCSKVYLLESLSIGMGLNDLGMEYLTYCWGLKCEERLLTASIPVSSPSSNIFKKNAKAYLNCLPKAFGAFYQKMDGISIAEGCGPHGYDLPSSLGDWRELRSFMEDVGRSPTDAEVLYHDFPESDLRVFIRCFNGELVICDLSGKVDGLYLLNSTGLYKKIEKPTEVLDSYFASVVAGEAIGLF